MSVLYVVFFFSSRRRHTRFDCDWSSDVCSSDLDVTVDLVVRRRDRLLAHGAVGPDRSGGALGTLELQISAGRGSGLLVAHRRAPDRGGGGARPNLLRPSRAPATTASPRPPKPAPPL